MRTLILLVCLSLATLSTPVTADTGCSEKTWSSGTNPEHTVAVHGDCTVDVELNKGIICVGPWHATDEYQVGPLHVTNHRCASPGGDPGTVELASTAGPCGNTLAQGIVTVTIHPDCTALISVKAYECVWNGHWHQHTPPPFEVREYRCSGPPQ